MNMIYFEENIENTTIALGDLQAKKKNDGRFKTKITLSRILINFIFLRTGVHNALYYTHLSTR